MLENAKKRAIALNNDENFIKCVPLNVNTMELYLKRMVKQQLITDTHIDQMDFFDKAKLCYSYFVKVQFE